MQVNIIKSNLKELKIDHFFFNCVQYMCSSIKGLKKKPAELKVNSIFFFKEQITDLTKDRKMNFLTGEVVKYLNQLLKEFVELEDFTNRKYLPIYSTDDGWMRL